MRTVSTLCRVLMIAGSINDTFADDSMGLGGNLTFYGPSIRAEIRF